MGEAFEKLDKRGICDGGGVAGLIAVSRLSLAATPAFVLMAFLTIVQTRGVPTMTIMCASDRSWLGGMTPMYLLMAAFHSGPWLKLIAIRRPPSSH